MIVIEGWSLDHVPFLLLKQHQMKQNLFMRTVGLDMYEFQL